MKKSTLYTIVGATALVLSTTLTVIANRVTASNQQQDQQLISANIALTPFNQLASKDETVYIITDTAGATTKSFIGSDINTSNESFPVEMQIAYTLNGEPISASDLAGKSGHVTVKYSFTATKRYQNKFVPFLVATGVSLDSNKFTNVKIDNGKIIKESDSIVLAGYALAGVNENLGTDFLPSSFTIEADTSDFKLDTTYSFATNEIFADIDTSKLNSIDDLINSINDLSAGLDQIITGSSSLASGLDSALVGSNKLKDGTSTLVSGVKTLSDGAFQLKEGSASLASGSAKISDGVNSLAEGATKLSGGLTQVSNNSNTLNQGAKAVFDSLLDNANTKINENPNLLYLISAYHIDFPLTIANYNNSLTTLINIITAGGGDASELVALKGSLDSYNNFYTGLLNYTGTVDYIAGQSTSLSDGANTLASQMPEFTAGANVLSAGATALASGTTTLLNGSTELNLGVNTLTDGISALTTGSHTLYDGLNTFKTSGIDRLVSFANNDLNNFLYNIRRTVSAANSYHSYSNPSATSVKFIFKTPSIK